MYTIIIRLIKKIYPVCLLYLLWIILHYCSSHLYTTYCTPLSITGFVSSPFLISGIHCYALRWIIIYGADIINKMWLMIGTWLAVQLIPN